MDHSFGRFSCFAMNTPLVTPRDALPSPRVSFLSGLAGGCSKGRRSSETTHGIGDVVAGFDGCPWLYPKHPKL